MIGKSVSHFRIVARIGEGGMGVVYRAEDERLRRPVALKVLPPELVGDEERRLRLLREAQAAAAVSHPNIAAIHEVGESEGVVFIAMELVEGRTLHSLIGGRALPIKDALRIAVEVADGLAQAHQAGVVHRDLKPDNVVVRPDRHVKILDFGLAKLLEGHGQAGDAGLSRLRTISGELSQQGRVFGTPAYMSPEQARGQPVDARSDLFSFGVTLYEMVSGRAPFHGRTTTDTLSAVLRDEPVPPSRLNPEVPPRLDEIIGKCLEKAPEERYQDTRDLLVDLRRLKRTTDSGVETLRPSGATAGAAAPGERRGRIGGAARRLGLAAGVAALLASAAVIWWTIDRAGSSGAGAAQVAIAVLPFQSMGSDTNAEFLRLALPDEIVTTLSYSASLAIRPFASTRKFTGADVDPVAAGRELRVADVVTGHYLREGERLQVTLEAIDVESNRLLWRDTVTVPAEDRIAMQEQVMARVRQGLLPALGAPAASGSATRPRSEEAYDLYLRASAMPRDAALNKDAIAMLERSVALDPSYAPAWAALGLRHIYDAQYSDGGDAAYRRGMSDFQQALALDPDFEFPAASLVQIYAEQGKLDTAYDQAGDLLRRRPESAMAHFTMGYVLRYGGLVDESKRECEAALARDPHNYAWRSCALVFVQTGDYAHALDFVRLDAGSEWAVGTTADVLVRQGKLQEAVGALPPGDTTRPLYRAWLMEKRPEPELSSLAKEAEKNALGFIDSEPRYWIAATLSRLGQRPEALRLLRSAVEQNYCSYPAMDRDPLFDGLRDDPEFRAIRAAGIECQRRFLERRARSKKPAQPSG